MVPSVEKTAITADLAALLIAAQFPHWAALPVRRVEPGGWDNVTFRLGADLSVRLPGGPSYAQQVDRPSPRRGTANRSGCTATSRTATC
jgi:aminoglycoside phosphotransferase (APT) family kinase protein